jgi:hypothetical protein
MALVWYIICSCSAFRATAHMWCTPQRFLVEKGIQWFTQCVVPHGMTHVLLMSQQLHCQFYRTQDVLSIFDLHASAGGN